MTGPEPQIVALKTCLPPIVSASTRLLLLGSLPGEASLAAARYYAHPRNQFWRLMERVVGEELVGLAYEDRLEVLARHAVGLWDTVGSAHRRGSLDGAMREIAPNPLRDLVEHLPRLRAIGFNGGTAARIGRRQLAESDMAMIDLPSSSPALTLAFEKKAERWTQLRPFLQSDD